MLATFSVNKVHPNGTLGPALQPENAVIPVSVNLGNFGSERSSCASYAGLVAADCDTHASTAKSKITGTSIDDPI